MKKLISFFFVALISASASIVKADDATYVANWELPVYSWFTQTIPTEDITRSQAIARRVENFDAMNCNFDAVWAANEGEYVIANDNSGCPGSNNGAADFSGAFKVLFDDDNMYVLLQYTDDDVTGTESVELMWAPYFKLDAIAANYPSLTLACVAYNRYTNFGAYKATYDSKGFNSAMMVSFNAAGSGTLNWGGTTPLLTANLLTDNHTATGSTIIKKIFTVGYPALTGEARPDFNTSIWENLNGGKGISFDIKVNDFDANDAKKNEADANPTPSQYWWAAKHNDGYAVTWHSGFLGTKITATPKVSMINSIFNKVTPQQILFTNTTNVVIYNSIGKQVLSLKNVDKVDLSKLTKGTFVIQANGETQKIVR